MDKNLFEFEVRQGELPLNSGDSKLPLYTNIGVEKCENDREMKERIDPDNLLENTSYFDSLMCPSKGSLILRGSEISNPYKFISVRLKPKLKWDFWLDSELENAIFTLVTADSLLDLKSFDNPIKPSIKYHNRISLQKDYWKRKFIYLKKNQASLYDNLFLSWEGKTEYFYSFSKTESDSYNWKNSDNPYSAEFFISLDSEQEVITRSVFNIFDLLAKVGGLYEFLNLIAWIVIWFTLDNQYTLSLISSIYHIKTLKTVVNDQEDWREEGNENAKEDGREYKQENSRNDNVLSNSENFKTSKEEEKSEFKIKPNWLGNENSKSIEDEENLPQLPNLLSCNSNRDFMSKVKEATFGKDMLRSFSSQETMDRNSQLGQEENKNFEKLLTKDFQSRRRISYKWVDICWITVCIFILIFYRNDLDRELERQNY